MTETMQRPAMLGRGNGQEVTIEAIRTAGIGSQFRDSMGNGRNTYYKSGPDRWDRYATDNFRESYTTEAAFVRITHDGRNPSMYQWDLLLADFQLHEPVTHDIMDRLPVGSVIVYGYTRPWHAELNESGDIWTKAANGWSRGGEHVGSPDNSQIERGHWLLRSIGTVEQVDHPQVGEMPGSVERLNSLPLGSVIVGDSDHVNDRADQHSSWRKVEGGWQNYSYGEPSDLVIEPGNRQESNLAQWYVHTIGTVEQPVSDVPLGCPPVGEYVTTRGQVVACPVGTVLSYTPDNLVKMGVNHWQAGGARFTDGNISVPVSHRVISYPEIVNPNLPAVGERLFRAGQFVALPVGSVIRGARESYVKVAQSDHHTEGWLYQRSGERFTGNWNLNGYNTVVSVGPLPASPTVAVPTAPEVIETAKQEIREVIDQCVVEQGQWAWVRDGAFWMLGILPLPEEGAVIQYGSAFGLPTGSVVKMDNRLWVVNNNNEKFPQILHGTAGRPQYQDSVTIVIRGDYTEPTYRDRNHLIHTLWERQRELRRRYDWCHAVEHCLNNAGLSDPGDVPDRPALAAPAVGVRTLYNAEQFALLPVGTVIVCNTNDTRYVRTTARPSGWAICATLQEANLASTWCTVL